MAKKPGRILIVDDDEFVLLSIKMLLQQELNFVMTESNPERIPFILSKENIDAVILDMNFRQGDTSGQAGLFWARKILATYPNVQVILITAYGDIEMAVTAVKEGVMDFVVKPWHNEKLLRTVMNAITLSYDKRNVRHLKSQQKSLVKEFEKNLEPIIGTSKAIQSIKNVIQKVASSDAEVLILGENGTGKEVVAREIHKQSNRREHAFISVDVGSLSEMLFESELFGHKKGSFTDAKEDRVGRIEAAAGGTLFLDEIGNLSLSLQAKLLTVLQKKSIIRLGTNEEVAVNVRIICATNGNLSQMVKEGKFREDLMYRINTVEITIPPLSERLEDLPELAIYFLKKFATKYHKPHLTSLTEDVLQLMQRYWWPGNIRELQHTIERAVIMCDSQAITCEDLGMEKKEINNAQPFDHLNLENLEAWAIKKALAKHKGNITHAAEELGLSRGAMYRRMERYGI